MVDGGSKAEAQRNEIGMSSDERLKVTGVNTEGPGELGAWEVLIPVGRNLCRGLCVKSLCV